MDYSNPREVFVILLYPIHTNNEIQVLAVFTELNNAKMYVEYNKKTNTPMIIYKSILNPLIFGTYLKHNI